MFGALTLWAVSPDHGTDLLIGGTVVRRNVRTPIDPGLQLFVYRLRSQVLVNFRPEIFYLLVRSVPVRVFGIVPGFDHDLCGRLSLIALSGIAVTFVIKR